MTTVIETLKHSIEGMTADRETTNNTVRELQAKIADLDTNVESHYAHIGRLACEALDEAG
jgi:hypothetical protein